MKSILTAGILLALAPAAIAGPYVRGEVEVKGNDGDYGRTKSQARLGYEYTELERTTPYVEVGGGAITPDGGDNEGFAAVEAGLKTQVTDKLTLKVAAENLRYDGDNNWKVKIGTRYTF
jgi:opacity protein-like surface antigen